MSRHTNGYSKTAVKSSSQTLFPGVAPSDLSIDLHGMNPVVAKKELERLVTGCPAHIETIEVIHGANRGDALMQMVRQELRHRRIASKILSMNPGVTILRLHGPCEGQGKKAGGGKKQKKNGRK